MERCNKCNKFVKGVVVPYNPYKADVMFIGDFPTKEDYDKNQHISKHSSRAKIDAYKNVLDSIGPFSYYVTNYVKCFTNSSPTPQQYFYCKENLIQEIKEVNPSIVIFLGNSSGSLKFNVTGPFRPRYMYSDNIHYILLQNPHQATLKSNLFSNSVEFLRNILPQLKKWG